jgi:hemolysin III
MNGVTHGMGVLVSAIGGGMLSDRVKDMSSTHKVSCAIYTTSLLVLYMSSTLYHSFFILQHTKYVFMVFDKCAIYILIAGSYTPFMQILFVDQPVWSVGLLGFIWSCAFLGISVEAFAPTWEWKKYFSLSMYIGLGWAALLCMPSMAERLPQSAMNLLVLGGVGYTAGVPFFIRNNNLDHAIWHLFVMSGSIFHWLCIYVYVAPLQLPEETLSTF